MPHKHRPKDVAIPNLRPGQSISGSQAKLNGNSFPMVGMTLPYYKAGDKQSLAANRVVKDSRWRRLMRGITLKRTLISLLIIALLIGGFLGGKFIYNAHKLFGGSIFSLFETTKLKGEDNGRVNILLAGNSSDDPGHQGADLTDSILLLSIDTKHNQAFMLSIPRDLWVNIPGTGYQKINDAYVVGKNNNFNESGYFPGGMGQLQQIVQQDFGISIDYYALVNYNAFRQSVNAVGGISVTINSSDPRGLYDPSVDYVTHGPLVKLSNGTHTLNGEQALDLARARGDAYGSYGFPGSDFDRTAHQRQMLLALKSKAVSAGVVANPSRLSSLFDAIGGNVKTDFSLQEIHRLYDLTKSINPQSINSIGLNNVNGQNLLTSYQTSSGESALIPAAGINNYSQIKAYLTRLTSNDPVVQEGASVVILNGSGIYGLATRERTTLETRNINVTAVGDARALQANSTIIDNSNGKKPATKQLLQSLLGTSASTTNPYAGSYNEDFIIVLGANQATSANAP